MNIRLFISIAFILTLLNNCNERNEVEDILSENCYWDILNTGSIHPINTCYKFEKDGGCHYYHYDFIDKARTESVFEYDDGDVVVPKTWNVSEDSIQIRAIRYRLIRYNSDSVFLKGKRPDTTVLLRNCKTINSRAR